MNISIVYVSVYMLLVQHNNYLLYFSTFLNKTFIPTFNILCSKLQYKLNDKHETTIVYCGMPF